MSLLPVFMSYYQPSKGLANFGRIARYNFVDHTGDAVYFSFVDGDQVQALLSKNPGADILQPLTTGMLTWNEKTDFGGVKGAFVSMARHAAETFPKTLIGLSLLASQYFETVRPDEVTQVIVDDQGKMIAVMTPEQFKAFNA